MSRYCVTDDEAEENEGYGARLHDQPLKDDGSALAGNALKVRRIKIRPTSPHLLVLSTKRSYPNWLIDNRPRR
jgi:hypothetical protein